MYPLIGIVVLVVIAGILIGGIAILFRRTRPLAPYFLSCAPCLLPLLRSPCSGVAVF